MPQEQSRIARPNSSSGSKPLVGRRKTPYPNPSSNSKPLESFDGQLVEKKMLFGRTQPSQRRAANSPTATVVERPAAAPVGSPTVCSAISHSVLSFTVYFLLLCIFSHSAISHCVLSLSVTHCVVSHSAAYCLSLCRHNTSYQAVAAVIPWCTAD